MTPISLTLTNFGSFTKEQTFLFPKKPGLYFMYGDNQAEPRLEGNAAGKSTVWKALTWLFFGKTAAGLKAGDVANWGVGKKTSVLLIYFNDEGVRATVERTWSPNSWKYWTFEDSTVHDLTKDVTNEVLGELQLEFAAFIQTVIMPQGSDLFLDLKANEQAELFSDVMGLDRWLTRAQRSSDRAREEDNECRRLERELSHALGELKSAREVNVEDQLRDFEATRRKRLDTLSNEHTYYVKLSKAKAAEVPVLEASLANARQRYAEALDKSERSKVCPECGQPMASPAHKAEVRALLRTVDEEEQALKTVRRDIAQIELTLDRIEDEADALDKQINPFTRLRADASRKVAALETGVHGLEQAVEAAQMRFSLASSWVRWFKEIRLAQIGEALEQLEIEVNNQVTALGLVDWELRFDVDKETKSGTIQRGFSVSVLSPHNSKPVPWEAWSGGERQRLIVAAQMGLANLSRSRTGTKLDLEVWDEPTTGMSPQGVADLLEALNTRAHREQRQIWVVDHRTLGFADFAGEAGVVKTTDGSHFDLSKMPAYK